MSIDPNDPKRSSLPDSSAQETPSENSAPPPSKPSGNKTSRDGDTNVVNIGESAKVDQIAVGRNILQAKVNIGSLVIPVRFLLVLLGVAAVAAVVVWWIVTPGQMPQNAPARIAVVEFAEQDEAGNPKNTGEGTRLSEWLYTRLNTELGTGQELGSNTQDVAPVAWHVATSLDPIHLYQKRYTAGPVRNSEDAERVATQVGADIVVYGTLTVGSKSASLQPQFFIRDDPSVQETPELVGSQQMGRPIPLPLPISTGAFETSIKPLGRIVYWLMRGLTFDLQGDFSTAYQEMRKGEPEVQAFDRNQGKEVFYYFMGTEALFLSQCEEEASKQFTATADRSAVTQALDAAETAYNKAIDAKRDYARAYFGLGQVASQRGQRLVVAPEARDFGQCRIAGSGSGGEVVPNQCPAQPPITDDPARIEQARAELMKSLDFYAQAIEFMQGSTDTLLLQRIQTVRAMTKLPLAQAYLLSSNLADAEPLIQEGIDELNALATTANAEQDPRVTALLNFGLGSGYFMQGYTRLIQNDPDGFKKLVAEADGILQACINIANQKQVQSDLFLTQQLLPNCTCLQIDVKKALSQ